LVDGSAVFCGLSVGDPSGTGCISQVAAPAPPHRGHLCSPWLPAPC